MVSCCVKQCGARKNKNRPQLTLHRFPVIEILKKKWLESIGAENINPRHKTWYVCSMHFDETCFNKTLDVTRLRDGAVPSFSLMIPDKTRKPILLQKQNIPESSCPMEVELSGDNLNKNAVLVKRIQRYWNRSIFTTKVNQTSSLVKLKKLQADFQAEDGKPIWLKGGPKDRILSSLTFFLSYVGILMTLTTVYDNAKPTSWKTSKTC